MIREWERLAVLKRSWQFGRKDGSTSATPDGFDCPACPSLVSERQETTRYG